jgi:aspartyl/asparaginyl beta-hydroxylase (cupin superfamily)
MMARNLAEEIIQTIWSSLCGRGLGHLDRVHGYLSNMVDGSATPENGPQRELFRHLYVPGLGPGPYFDPDSLPQLDRADELAAIQEEARSAFAQGTLLIDHSDLVVGNAPSVQARWDCLYFRKEFVDVEETHRLFPATSRFLRRHRLATEALYSRLAPQTTIEPHSDCANYVATVHLPLGDSPATIRVADIEKGYVAGQTIFFDSSFTHSVENAASNARDILLFNVWHPELSDDEISALTMIRELWPASTAFDPDSGFSA